LICSGCGPSTCRNKATETSPRRIACPLCNEAGCDECDNEGHFEIVGCPQRAIDRDVIDFLTYADFAKQGTFPVAGGTLDQSSWFLQATQFLLAEERKVEAESWKDI